MKSIILAMSLVFSQFAIADTYSAYEALANDIIEELEAGSLTRDSLMIKSGRLIQLGEEIMRAYAASEPGCAAQFNQFLQEHARMEHSTFDQLHDRYHDAIGLPAATGGAECYVARSMVAHPYMGLALAREGIPSDIEPLLEEFGEVAERAPILGELLAR